VPPRTSRLFRGLAGLLLLVVAVLIFLVTAVGLGPLVRILMPLVGVVLLAFLLPIVALAGARRLLLVLAGLRLTRWLLMLAGLRRLRAVV
jgi:uncharacterized membrane protein YkvI